MAGAAYARATDGILYDCEGGKVHSPQQAVELARDLEKEMPELEAKMKLLMELIYAEHLQGPKKPDDGLSSASEDIKVGATVFRITD
jgi:hypothetical protein